MIPVRKGLSRQLGLTVVTFFALALIMNIGISRVSQIDDRVALQSVPIVADRVEVALYALDVTPEKSSVQMELNDEFNLSDAEGGAISYEFNSYLPSEYDVRTSRINPPEDIEFSIEEKGDTDVICIRNSGEMKVYAGEC